MLSRKIQLSDILARKNGPKLTCLTAYTYPVAKILDDYCDIILVGDSLGMCIYGLPDTVDVTLEMMINHGQAVMRAAKKSFVVVDIPYGTYETSPLQALQTARRIIEETGCDAVKIETNPNSIAAIDLMARNNIAVMAHVGLLPQQVRQLGGYKYQGRNADSAAQILHTAQKAQQAGAFACVIEAVPQHLATEITNILTIPTIGIGASAQCDGQILVIDDLIGLNQEFKPKFVKNYANIAQIIKNSAQEYDSEVKSNKFPAPQNLVD